jgi:hypothetical protein
VRPTMNEKQSPSPGALIASETFRRSSTKFSTQLSGSGGFKKTPKNGICTRGSIFPRGYSHFFATTIRTSSNTSWKATRVGLVEPVEIWRGSFPQCGSSLPLKGAIDRSYPLAEDWLTAYRAQAHQALRLASLASSTDADKNAYPFLNNEFNSMKQLSDKYLQISLSRTYIAPGSLDSDPLDQKMGTCGRSLAAMATANQFVDDGSCQ